MRLCHGWSILGVALLYSGLTGCAAQRDDSLRLSEELGRARADAEWQGARAAELESRLSRVEQRVATHASTGRAEDRELLSRLDRLIEMNERLLAERAPAPVATEDAATGTPAAHPLPPSATHTASNRVLTPSEEQELRALVVRLRGRPSGAHGALTREQESALRVLMRPERKLDAENPWAKAIY